MTDTNAPERIYFANGIGWTADLAKHDGLGPEYIRADLATPAPREDGYSAGVRAALPAMERCLSRLDDLPVKHPQQASDKAAFRAAILALLDAPALPDARAGAVEPVDDCSLSARIGELGNQLHNMSCEHQNDERLSERLSELRGIAWSLASEVAAPPTPACTATDGPASACVRVPDNADVQIVAVGQSNRPLDGRDVDEAGT